METTQITEGGKIVEAIDKKDKEIQKIWKKIRDEKEKTKLQIIEKLKGIKRTTGQHPGGLLISLPNIEICKYTPLNYPANNYNTEKLTTHFEYSFLSKSFLKIDILGHDEPTVLQKLFELTNIDPTTIDFSDKKIMNLFTTADTLGIPEFGTDFVRENLLLYLKPTKFSHLVQISGFAHGTNIWKNNQRNIYKDKLLPLDNLIACKEDIWEFLISCGIEKKKAFIATEYIRKGKWEEISENIKREIKDKLVDKKGRIYLSILEKIKYIFPKPHAISYTTTAWRTAFYKVYHIEKFYSVILTHHATVYDIWLMSLNHSVIMYHLNDLVENAASYKSDENNLNSILKVLAKLAKENGNNSKIIDFSLILGEIRNKLNKLKEENDTWQLTMKEKQLLFTLRIILEMKKKELNFSCLLDLNKSEIDNFRIENEIFYFPLTAISGIGVKIASEINNHRKKIGKFTYNWRKELNEIINKNHLKSLDKLDEYNLLTF